MLRLRWRSALILLLFAVSPVMADDVLDLAAATLVREQLEDDVLILGRVREAQESLITLNDLRRRTGQAPVALPAEICPASPLTDLCPHLPATFGRSEP